MTRLSSIPFIDLRYQYPARKDIVNKRIQQVLEHGQYIMGSEVKELEEKLAAYTHLCEGQSNPVSVEASRTVMSLPMGADLDVEAQRFIASSLLAN